LKAVSGAHRKIPRVTRLYETVFYHNITPCGADDSTRLRLVSISR
jgi:hypothetical protein